MRRSSVTKACDILIALRDEGALTRGMLSKHLGLPKSSLHWMLEDLEDAGIVDCRRPARVSGKGSSPFVFSLNADWRKK